MRRVWQVVMLQFALTTLLCTAARAQAYATASGPGSYVSVGGGASIFQADYGKQEIEGGFAYVDVHPQWRVGLEGEARSLRYNAAEQVTESNYLGGLRVQVLRPRRLQPYVKFLAGMGRITLPFNYARGSFLDYAPGAGLDIALTQRITLRAADLEYQRWPKFTFGQLSPYGWSTGISVRLNAIHRYPNSNRVR